MKDKRDKVTTSLFSQGQPRKYASNAEKMRAYRKRLKDKSVTLLSEKTENLNNIVTVNIDCDIELTKIQEIES